MARYLLEQIENRLDVRERVAKNDIAIRAFCAVIER
jgi:hypothetical protein